MARGYTLQRLNANSMNSITGDFVLPKLPAANTMYPPFEQSLAKHVYNIFLTLTLTPQEDLSSFDFHDQILNPYFIDRYWKLFSFSHNCCRCCYRKDAIWLDTIQRALCLQKKNFDPDQNAPRQNKTIKGKMKER